MSVIQGDFYQVVLGRPVPLLPLRLRWVCYTCRTRGRVGGDLWLAESVIFLGVTFDLDPYIFFNFFVPLPSVLEFFNCVGLLLLLPCHGGVSRGHAGRRGWSLTY